MKAFVEKNRVLRATTCAALLICLSALAQNSPTPPAGPPLPPGLTPNPLAPVFPRVVSPPVTPPANPAPIVVQPSRPGPVVPLAPPLQPQLGTFPAQSANPNALKWDAETKEYTSKPGETNAYFSFWLTNVSSSDVLINSVRTSCGCTVARLPEQPWRIPPQGSGPIDVTVNLVGKSGVISKGVTVDSSVGVKTLIVKVNIAGAGPTPLVGVMGDTERLQNMQKALADRQVVFKNQECAKCHSDPAKGKIDGRELYAAVCYTCHDSHLRAAMVPDLRALKHPTDVDHWRKWITYGRAGSMMPAFAESEGGPLNPQQIDALVNYMVRAYPSHPLPAQNPNPSAAQVNPHLDKNISAFPLPKTN